MGKKLKYVKSLFLFMVFMAYTALVRVVDVQDIGPLNSRVGFATLNGAAAKLIGTNNVFYAISEIIGLSAFLVCAGFGVVGLVQWIKRKKILKVDLQIIILGLYYIAVIGLYFLFNFVIINYRPVLDEGLLEPSYPSSHTMLAVCVYAAAAFYTRFLPKGYKYLRKPIITVCYVIIALMVVTRLLAGVHWLSDIIGGILLSITMISLLVSVIKEYCK